MTKSEFSVEQLATISQIQERNSITRKSAIRKFEKELKAAKIGATKVVPAPQPKTDAGKARAAGRELYNIAGKPTQAQCIAVYGPRAPVLTWAQRAKMGVDAAHFQKAMKSGKYVGPDTKEQAAQG
jgi:hypothetical protein